MKNNPRSCERNLCNCVRSLKEIQDFNGTWTRDFAIPVRCSNQLSYEATDVGTWSIMCSYVPVKEMNVIDVYEINHIRTAEMKSNEQWSSQLWTQFMQLYFISIYHNMVIYLTIKMSRTKKAHNANWTHRRVGAVIPNECIQRMTFWSGEKSTFKSKRRH